MPRKQRDDGSRLFGDEVCGFCGINDDDELLYGKFIVSDEISMHNNCMFFASGLVQRGKNETVGFSGFILRDIETELRRGKKLACAYCRKRGATVGCCVSKCKKSFHLPCGIEHDSLHQHFGSFSSFCKEHSPKQKPVEVTKERYCHICCEEISTNTLINCLYSPCCKNSWFHKLCLQKYALSAGSYFFKCPLCNDSKKFVKEMEEYGICVPEKDASWELEDNAYEDLLVRPVCGVDVCQCPKGRKYSSPKNSGWTLLSCSVCGSHARHKTCENLNLSITSWMCEECKSIEQKICENKEASTLAIEVKETLYVEDPVSEQNDINISDPTSSSSPSFNSFCLSTSSHLNLVLKDEADKLQYAIPDIIASNQVHNETNEIHASFNVCVTLSSNNEIMNAEDKAVENFGQQKVIIENDFGNFSHDCKSKSNQSKISNQVKQGNNLKDIKNISPTVFDTLKKSGMEFKARTIKKPVKKRKISQCSSCSDPKHSCIRKYFGQECGKYRL